MQFGRSSLSALLDINEGQIFQSSKRYLYHAVIGAKVTWNTLSQGGWVRLVQNEKPWPTGDRTRDPDAGLLPAGKLVRETRQ